MLGVAKVKLLDGKIIGRRAKPFSYTGKNIISDKDFQFHLQQEILNIKNTIPDEHGKKENGQWILEIKILFMMMII